VKRSEFDLFCEKAFGFLRETEVPYLVVGGLAVIALGEPRTTGDADVVAFIRPKEAEKVIRWAARSGFEVDLDRELECLKETGTFSLRIPPFHLDVILASLPFEEEALHRSRPQRLFGLTIPFPTPEDLILFKILAGREKDLLDAQGVIRRHGKKLDVEYIEKTLRSLCDLAEDITPWNRWKECLAKSDADRGN